MMFLNRTKAMFNMIDIQFIIDGRFRMIQDPTDFKRIFIGFPQSVNLLTFVLCELAVVSHQYISFFQH